MFSGIIFSILGSLLTTILYLPVHVYNLKPLDASMLLGLGIYGAGKNQTNSKRSNCSSSAHISNVEYIGSCENSNKNLMVFDVANSHSKVKNIVF